MRQCGDLRGGWEDVLQACCCLGLEGGRGMSAGWVWSDVHLTAVVSLQGSWMRRNPLKLI